MWGGVGGVPACFGTAGGWVLLRARRGACLAETRRAKSAPLLRSGARQGARLRSADSRDLKGLRRPQASDQLTRQPILYHLPSTIFLVDRVFVCLPRGS